MRGLKNSVLYSKEQFLDKYQKKEVETYDHKVDFEPKVSVLVMTYQHSDFIRDCLEGILMQETDFDYEILIGEDYSTDGTREICIEYAEKYPNKIRLFLHNEKNKLIINGNKTGRFNFSYNFYSARGEYIALCEGDDYWTDSKKLQSQVDFLENNKEFSMCFHDVKILNKGNLVEDFITRKISNKTDIYELAKGNYMHTPTVVFKKNFSKLPQWFFNTTIADFPLHLMNAIYGDIYHIDKKMAVYRIHHSNYWANQKKDEKIFNQLFYKKEMLNKFSDKRVNKILFEIYIKLGISAITYFLRENKIEQAKQVYNMVIKDNFNISLYFFIKKVFNKFQRLF